MFPPSPLGTSQRSKSCVIGGAPEQSDPASKFARSFYETTATGTKSWRRFGEICILPYSRHLFVIVFSGGPDARLLRIDRLEQSVMNPETLNKELLNIFEREFDYKEIPNAESV